MVCLPPGVASDASINTHRYTTNVSLAVPARQENLHSTVQVFTRLAAPIRPDGRPVPQQRRRLPPTVTSKRRKKPTFAGIESFGPLVDCPCGRDARGRQE